MNKIKKKQRPLGPMYNTEDNTKKNIILARNASNYFEKFERFDCQELLAQAPVHWLLSQEDFRFPIDPPAGLISRCFPFSQSSAVILLPIDDNVPPIDYRIIHQIIRELTHGIFLFNETPWIKLQANFDESTTCQIPPAYIDTSIGQLLITVDYMMKSLWHGVYFPKDKRHKFSDKWRSNLDVNSYGVPESKKPLLIEFSSAGIIDITKESEYASCYDNVPIDLTDPKELEEEREFFLSLIDDISMQITLFQNEVVQHENLFVVDSDWFLSSVVKIFDDRLDRVNHERLATRLHIHEEIIRKNLENKTEIRRALYLLKFVSFMVPLLIALRKRMKIPFTEKFMPQLTGEDVRTERELPPIIIGPETKCKNFGPTEHYFNLHGGIGIDIETSLPTPPSSAILNEYSNLCTEAENGLTKHLKSDLPVQEHYEIPVKVIDGKKYLLIEVPVEAYYSGLPQKPTWLTYYLEEIVRHRLRKLPFNDVQIHEQFKKYYGMRRAIKNKTPHNGLKSSAERGLVGIFQALIRKIAASRLVKSDEIGMTYMHYAAIHNCPLIIDLLIMQSMDVNVRRGQHLTQGAAENSEDKLVYQFTRAFAKTNYQGPTPLHLAARMGAIDAVSCLIANFANITILDVDGWMPIHHAAFCNQMPIVRLLIRRSSSLMEAQTKNILKSTPLLLAASSGSLNVVELLIKMGADITTCDTENNGIVSLAALRFHTNVLEYLIGWSNKTIPVWQTLVEMLRDENEEKRESSVKCMEILSTLKPAYWTDILQADGIPALVDMLDREQPELQTIAASVMCNISEQNDVRLECSRIEASVILIKLLASPVVELQSRAAVILSDIACVDGNQASVAEQGGVPALIKLLDSDLEDVLVNTVNALRVLCLNHPQNQSLIVQGGAVEHMVEFLTINSEILQAATASSIAALTNGHPVNQDLVISEGIVKPVINLIKGRNVTVQVKAAAALQALSTDNENSQLTFIKQDAPKALIRLLKNINVTVREQGATALWSLAGNTKFQQRRIAETIGIPHIIQMLLEPTEKLLHVGCNMAIAFGRESIEKQNLLADADAFAQLVRLLRSQKVPLSVKKVIIKVMGILCVGVAYRNNSYTQKKLAEEGAIAILIDLFTQASSAEIKVEVANTLGCVVLSNRDNQDKLREDHKFEFNELLHLLQSPDQELRLKAGMALTIFAFNNTPQQYAIREAGGISYSVFHSFLISPTEYFQCYAAFQIVVLARVIRDKDQVALTAQGITLLVDHLLSVDEKTIILSASLLSSLAHTRAGIPDAMVTTGAMDRLLDHLYSPILQVRQAVAITLGYMTYNKTAARIMLTACRNRPRLFDKFSESIGEDAKVSREFMGDFRRAKAVGLPSQSLEINGGPPVIPPIIRPATTDNRRKHQMSATLRAVSAPPKTCLYSPQKCMSTNRDSHHSAKFSEISFKSRKLSSN